MTKAKPITATGRKRVEAAMAKHGMLLVQGQDDLPSIADLLEGAPIRTRGYSHDYVPAWTVRGDLIRQPDYALVKLFGGKNTVVHRRHWPALNALACSARANVLKRNDGPARILKLIEAQPGITGDGIKRALELVGKSGAREFQRDKAKLEQWLCLEGREQEETDYHVHDSAWFPWSKSKIAGPGGLSIDDAAKSLLAAVYDNPQAEPKRIARVFPVRAAAQD
jgi:hypothetical protein